MKVRISMRASEFRDFVGLCRTLLGQEVESPREIVLGVINCETLEKMLAKYTIKLMSPLKNKVSVTLSDLEILALVSADEEMLINSTYSLTYLEVIELINQEHLKLKNHRENMRGNMRMELRG